MSVWLQAGPEAGWMQVQEVLTDLLRCPLHSNPLENGITAKRTTQSVI